MQGDLSRHRVGPRAALAVLLACAAVSVVAGIPAHALAAGHIFDPALSLTGGCTTSKVDPVPDPGCTEEEGEPHQPGSFVAPKGVTTDFYGNIYVANEKGSEGRIDIFDPAGNFITQVLVSEGAQAIAVDSEGNLYVVTGSGKLILHEPTAYEGKTGDIQYGSAPELVASAFPSMAIAINVSNDRLFAHYGGHVTEFASAAEGNGLLDDSIGEEDIQENFDGLGLAVDAAQGRIYVSESGPQVTPVVKVFDLDSPHELLQTIDGSEVPAGGLPSFFSLAVDEESGNLFLYSQVQAVYEFSEDGKYLESIKNGFQYTTEARLVVDNGLFSPNGALNPDGRYLFVASHPSGVGHAFAFGPEPDEAAPEVESIGFANVTEAEAELQALINPRNLPTDYTFEYTTRQSFEEKGFEGAQLAGEGQLPPGDVGVLVSATATDLLADTAYRFRVLATNSQGDAEEEGEFRTYPVFPVPPCPNDPLRIGFSAPLPDCRAYELVTPPDTNARTPMGVDHLGIYFATREASPAGDAVSFLIEGGSLPGAEATGSWAGDPYLARRGEKGWETTSAGPTGAESLTPLPGSTSPDQGYSFWQAGVEGSASVEGKATNYVRYPDGHSELVGRGSLDTDPRAEGKLIAENGAHIVFVSGGLSAVRLEEDAPPDGTKAI